TFGERAVNRGEHVVGIYSSASKTERGRLFGNRRDAVIRRERDQCVIESDASGHKIEQRRNLLIDSQRNIHRFLAVWSITMAHVIVGRKADGENIRVVVLPELLVDDRLLGKRNEQIVTER